MYVIVEIGPFKPDLVILHSVTSGIQDGGRNITQITQKWDS